MSSTAPSPSPPPGPGGGGGGGGAAADDAPVRLFQVWPGRNRFVCGGVCITGPDRRWPLGTLTLLLVPSALFLAFVAADFVDRGDEWVMVFAAVSLCMTLVSFGWTSLSDPGIVPRQTDANKSSAGRQVPRTQNAVVNGRPASLKFCPTCNIYRPPRAVHCSVCDNCVEVFDHHCPWVGNCVGKGNYRAFLSFLFWCTTYVVFVLATSVRHMVVYTQDERDADDSLSGGEAFGKALARNPVSLITALLSFLFFWFPLGLFSFHIYLTCTGQSTNEMLKGAFPFGSPYSRGGCHNWVGLCCRLPEPGHFRRRTKVDPRTNVPLKAPRVVMLEVIPDPNSPRSRSASAPPRPVAAGNSRPGSPVPGPLSRAPTTEGPRLDPLAAPAASRV